MTTFANRNRTWQREKRKRQSNETKPLPHGQRMWPHFIPDSEPSRDRLMPSLGVLLLAVVALIFVTGCCGTVPKANPYRPPEALMKPAPTQYLLPEAEQRGLSSTVQ